MERKLSQNILECIDANRNHLDPEVRLNIRCRYDLKNRNCPKGILVMITQHGQSKVTMRIYRGMLYQTMPMSSCPMTTLARYPEQLPPMANTIRINMIRIGPTPQRSCSRSNIQRFVLFGRRRCILFGIIRSTLFASQRC